MLTIDTIIAKHDTILRANENANKNILFQLFKHARYIPVKLGGEESIVNAQLRLKQKQRKK
jgi:hypothetical protein